MYFDRLDVAEAWHCWLSLNHGGQWSREYARLSKLTRSFRPRPTLSVDTLTDNGRAIFDNIAAQSNRRA